MHYRQLRKGDPVHISRLVIRNYRSIKNLDLRFEKGKNVIIGRNNAGKSNIIKAIDLILGESSPTYQKSQNITENDFFKGDTSSPIYILCQLERDHTDDINYEEIYANGYGYSIHAAFRPYWEKDQQTGINIAYGDSKPYTFNLKSIDECCTTIDRLININPDDPTVYTRYITPKVRHLQLFEEELDDKDVFMFIFRARADTGKIVKDMRLLYRSVDSDTWTLAFQSVVRNELLQSAIIPAFRDPYTQLRISDYNWYGKLLKHYSVNHDEELFSAFEAVKKASDGIFKSLIDEINDSSIRVAFPNTDISIQYNPESKKDIHKSALIYVDDGFNSLLTDKGSGIQSAVIIGLFDYYTRNVSHCSCSLLAIEEPELYLHPHGRRVISNRLDNFLEGGRNQVILTTHSSEFITAAQDSVNLIVVNKDKDEGTLAKNTRFDDPKEHQILVKTENSEMFFAKKVLLVEGGDKYILEAIAQYYGMTIKPELGKNWLNDNNISIIAVGGKEEFWKYVNKLNELNIENYVLADFDFLLTGLNKFFKKTGMKTGMKFSFSDALNGLNSKIGPINMELSPDLQGEIVKFAETVRLYGHEINPNRIKGIIKESKKIKSLNRIPAEHQDLTKEFIDYLKDYNIFILQNELEDNYTEMCQQRVKGISGKEMKAIYIGSSLLKESRNITDLICCDEYIEFLDRVRD